MISTADINYFRRTSLLKAVTLLILLFNFTGNVFGQDPASLVPSYEWIDDADLPDITVDDLNAEDITIAIAVDAQGFLYTLSFGNGVDKRDADGNVISKIISPGELNSPLDIAISSEGLIFIADYFQSGSCSDNGKIKVFDQSGQQLTSRTILTGFYRPIGLAIDSDDNIYVAEYNEENSGCENDELSRLRIYKNDGSVITNSNNINQPFRVAVDSRKNVFVSQGNGQVLMLDQNLNFIKALTNLQSPAGLAVDSFDFLHVLEYANRVDFEDFINYDELSTTDLISIAGDIRNGIRNEDFVIKIFDSNQQYRSFIIERIDFPFDLDFNSCDRMYVDNSNVEGIPILFGGFIPTAIRFDLEIYERTPAFDITDPVITCPADITAQAEPGKNYAVVTYPNASATDVCGVTVSRTSDLASGSQFPEGENFVEFTATDSFGNTVTCSFKITVEPAEEADTPPEFENCPGNITKSTDPGLCGAVVTFNTPSVSDDGGAITPTRIDNSGLNSGDVFPVGETTITFQADDGVNAPVECTFMITVSDNESPKFTNCPTQDTTISLNQGETYTIPDYRTQINYEDNCDTDLAYAQDPDIGTEINETTNVTLTITDDAGLQEQCSFDVIINQESVDTPPEFTNCPTNIAKNNDSGQCGAVVTFNTPSVSDDGGPITPTRTDNSGLNSGDVFPVGETTITFQADDGVNAPVECSFTISVIDNEAPDFDNCTNRNLEIMIAEGSAWNLQDFRDDFTATDNCDGELVFTQDPAPGTPINEITDVAVRVTDESGNTKSCLFTINVIIVPQGDLIINCPGNYTIFADENCEYRVPDLSEVIEVSNDQASIEQSLAVNSVFDPNSDPYVTVTATFEGETAICDIYLFPVDEIDPVIECPGDKNINLSQGESYTIPDYTEIAEISDNCGEVSVTQQPEAGTIINENTEVMLTATDAAGNFNFCEFNINIQREGGISISCPEDVTAGLDGNCEYRLPDFTVEAGINASGEFEIIQIPAPGTVVTAGVTEVSITVSDNNSSDSCSFNVFLEDNTAPVLSLKDPSIAIGSNGLALISFDDIDNGSFDNCDSEVSYLLSKSTFTCKNLGENLVEVTAEDRSGNISTANAIVTITDEQGFCDDPLPGSDYIFIYPNPNIGSFKIATPAEEIIERVEVFDHRGRFIAAKDYESTDIEYAMQVGPLQEAVYVLKIVTNERTVTKHIIFKY